MKSALPSPCYLLSALHAILIKDFRLNCPRTDVPFVVIIVYASAEREGESKTKRKSKKKKAD